MPQADWSEAERWVWDEIRAGKIANFHERVRKLDPLSDEGWSEERLLRAVFLREIFYDKSLKEGDSSRRGSNCGGAHGFATGWSSPKVDCISIFGSNIPGSNRGSIFPGRRSKAGCR